MTIEKQSDYLLGAKVFSIINKNPNTVEGVTKKIYGNLGARNIVRIYQCIMIMLKEGIMIPQFKNGVLIFKCDNVSNIDES